MQGLSVKELSRRTGRTVPSILLGVLKGHMQDELDKNPNAVFSVDLLDIVVATATAAQDPNPDQLEVILRELRTRNTYYCECCDELFVQSWVVAHYWYEPPDYNLRVAAVCRDCKGTLTPDLLWGEYKPGLADWMEHVLPDFNLQRMAVRVGDKDGLYLSSLRSAYVFPLPVPSWKTAKLVIDGQS